MRNYGRRLKRYFFLKREKLNLFGGVEDILPNKITGWIYAEKLTIDEIRLYVGEQLISKSTIFVINFILSFFSRTKMYFKSSKKLS